VSACAARSNDATLQPGSALIMSACEAVIDSPQQAQKYQLQRRLLYAHANTSPDLIGENMVRAARLYTIVRTYCVGC
jgi:hypothetical protein